jgi:glycine betaine catabolism A
MVNQPQSLQLDPVPLDPAALEAALRPFGESRMLPRAAYVSQEVFAWEQRNFFDGGWTCVGRSEDLAQPGDQRAESVGRAGVFLMRDNDSRLRAFANACRHRGHELLPCGVTVNRPIVVCPYHAWSYRLDGRLRKAPGFDELHDFEAGDFGLVELPAEEWHGYIFVDASGGDGPLSVHMQGLEEIIAPYEPERLRVAGRHEYEVAANWKILSENYQECYHCPIIHPELCAVSPPQSGENYVHPGTGSWVGGWMELREGMDTMSLDGKRSGTLLRGLSGDITRHVDYIGVFPNLLVSLHPDYVMSHRLTPVAPDRTRIECSWAFSPEDIARDDFDPAYAVDFWDITNREDWLACESVQRGLSSPHAVPGPLSRQEDAVYQLVTMVARGYAGLPRVANEAAVR